jgi:hypothetical protein
MKLKFETTRKVPNANEIIDLQDGCFPRKDDFPIPSTYQNNTEKY